MIFIGIDLGMSGGICVLDERGRVVSVRKMPETDVEILEVLKLGWLELGQHPRTCRAVIERVWSSPQMGVVSAFKFGTSVGAMKMALAAAKIPYDEVLPAHWQKALGCLQPRRPKGTPNPVGSKDKNITKRRAEALFPDIKVTHAIADALLIAEFCRRLHSGAASTARPAQQEMPYGEESEEDRRLEEREASTRAEAGREEDDRAAQAETEVAAGHGAAKDRAHRKRGSRLRRRA